MISVNITWKFTSDSQYLFAILRKNNTCLLIRKIKFAIFTIHNWNFHNTLVFILVLFRKITFHKKNVEDKWKGKFASTINSIILYLDLYINMKSWYISCCFYSSVFASISWNYQLWRNQLFISEYIFISFL